VAFGGASDLALRCVRRTVVDALYEKRSSSSGRAHNVLGMYGAEEAQQPSMFFCVIEMDRLWF